MTIVRWAVRGHGLKQRIKIEEKKDEDLIVPLNISDAIVRLEVQRRSDDIFVQNGVVIDGPLGVCEFTLTKTGALLKSGTFRARTLVLIGEQEIPGEWFTFVVE